MAQEGVEQGLLPVPGLLRTIGVYNKGFLLCQVYYVQSVCRTMASSCARFTTYNLCVEQGLPHVPSLLRTICV
jgi:hypothetical protein